MSINQKILHSIQIAFVLLFTFIFILPAVTAHAASCPAQANNLGTDTATINIPTTGTYQIWSRIMAPNSTENQYLLQIDGNSCYTVGGSNIPANTWTWEDFQNGESYATIDATLTAGSHTVELIGTDAGLELDNLIFTIDTTCVPIDTGTNCSNPIGTATQTVTVTSSTHSSITSTILTATATAYNNINLSWVEAANNKGIVGYYILRNGVIIGWTAATSYSDSTVNTDSSYRYQIEAYDAAGTIVSTSNSATVTTPYASSNGTKPSAPKNLIGRTISTNQINLTWKNSTINDDITGYYVYRSTSRGPASRVATVTSPSYGDANLSAGTNYTYYVSAHNAAGNVSSPSSSINMTTTSLCNDPSSSWEWWKKNSSNCTMSTGTISGNVSGKSGMLVSASLWLQSNSRQITYTTNSTGTYSIGDLPAGNYTVSYEAKGYDTKTVHINVSANHITNVNVKLTGEKS